MDTNYALLVARVRVSAFEAENLDMGPRQTLERALLKRGVNARFFSKISPAAV
jgi:hypothetical protein